MDFVIVDDAVLLSLFAGRTPCNDISFYTPLTQNQDGAGRSTGLGKINPSAKNSAELCWKVWKAVLCSLGISTSQDTVLNGRLGCFHP